MFFIVTLDGGGVRGILEARLIQRLQKKAPFLHRVHFFAGTSIGGLNAAYLAKRRTSAGLVELFKEHSEAIFASRGWWDSISSLDELIKANYDQTGLKAALEGIFGDETLADLPVKCMVVTFDLDNEAELPDCRRWKPKYGHNWSEEDGSVKVVDWLLRTAAAPTYFPSHQGFVDGGMIDNNPSAAALAKAVKEGAIVGEHSELLVRISMFFEELSGLFLGKAARPSADAFIKEIRDTLESQIYLLSFGTGLNPRCIPGDEHDWGYKQWLQESRLLNMLFDGMTGPPHYICTQLLGERYHRLNPVLDEPIELDDVDRVERLIEIADDVDISATVEWLQKMVAP